ncbi:MAG TPA: hypothetical protein VK795_11245, partial [Terriglobales bacterium]|nr:hypothetical protein [Terriglobales bacterium]
MPEIPPPSQHPDDPITSYSFTLPLLIASLLLILTVAWSFWDEVYGLRPWRSYQSRFAASYSKYLDKAVQDQKKQEAAVYNSAEYKKLSAQVDELQKTTKTQDDQIAKQIGLLDEQRAALGDAFKDARGKIGHLVYEYETVPDSDKNAKAKALKAVTDGRASVWKVDWPLGDGKVQKDKPFTGDELNDTFTSIMAQRAALVAKRAEIDKPAKEASDVLALYVTEHLPGLSSASLESLQHSMKDFDERIIQINVNPSGASL